MKKRIEKMIMDVAANDDPRCNNKKFIVNGRFFVTDGVRIAEFYDDGIDNLEIRSNIDLDKKIDGLLEEDYISFDLPSIDCIKSNIRSLCGRKLDRVVYKNDLFAVNARFLYKAMEALNAKTCYFCKRNSKRNPVIIFENDDITSINKIAIFPVMCCDYSGAEFCVAN